MKKSKVIKLQVPETAILMFTGNAKELSDWLSELQSSDEISKDLNMSEQEIKTAELSALTKISNYLKTITGVDENSNNPQEASSSKQLEKNRIN